MMRKTLLTAMLLTLSGFGCVKKVREEYGPVEAAPSDSPANSQVVIGPELPVGPMPGPGYVPPQDAFVLVLGPGLARGFAYLGVIEELEKHQIKISGIAGVEIGAIVGSIYASSNLNTLSWELHKFRRKTLIDTGLINLRSNAAPGKDLKDYIKSAVKVDRLEKMQVPMVVVSAIDGTGDEILADRSGPTDEILRGAMGLPGVIEAYEYEGTKRISGAVNHPFPVAAAKDLGLGNTICVDVLGKGLKSLEKGSEDPFESRLNLIMRSAANSAKADLKECDHTISIRAEDIGYLNFSAKAELIARGRKSAQAFLKTLGQ